MGAVIVVINLVAACLEKNFTAVLTGAIAKPVSLESVEVNREGNCVQHTV
jgi:hypothetical protein